MVQNLLILYRTTSNAIILFKVDSPYQILRPLSQIEEALTLTGIAYPLSLVCTLRLDQGTSAGNLRSGLDMLQKRHPLLNAAITKRKGRFWFERLDPPVPIPLITEPRKDDQHWLESSREEVNLGFAFHTTPLMRVRYLTPTAPGGKSEIILTLHHSVTDAVSLLGMADELLTFTGNSGSDQSIHPNIESSGPALSPLLKEILPGSLKGPGFWFHLFPFLLRQLKDERDYAGANRHIKESAIPASSVNDLYVTDFSEEETAGLIKWSRRNRVSMNNILIAAMVLVMNGKVYGGMKKLMRTVQFANLRPYLQPPVAAELEGSFINLMRVSVPLFPGSNIVQLAAYLDRQYLESARRGDKFLYALLSPVVMRKTIRENRSRLGNVALSYAGSLRFRQQYGSLRLHDVHGFITNNAQGAEIACFGKICFGRLSLDMNFLSEETSREKATMLLEEIRALILETISES